jgi:thymidylate kinase
MECPPQSEGIIGMTAPLVVEFAGVPGSGKSSLSREVSRRLRAKDLAAFTVIEAARIRAAQSLPGEGPLHPSRNRVTALVLWWLFYAAASFRAAIFIWRCHDEVVTLARLQSRRDIRSGMKAHNAWWYLQLVGRRMYLDTSRAIEAILYDDGFVHRSVALFSSPGEPGPVGGIDSYLASIPTPDVVVSVSTDVDTCLRRVVNRGIWDHSESATHEELLAYLRAADTILQRAIDYAQTRGATVVRVDNGDGSFEDAASKVTARLESILSTSSSPKRRS